MSPTRKATDGGASQMQEAADARTARGYDGVVPDPTPNYNYTVAGNEAPTPETDRELKLAADERSREIEEAFADVRQPPAPPEEPAPPSSDDGNSNGD